MIITCSQNCLSDSMSPVTVCISFGWNLYLWISAIKTELLTRYLTCVNWCWSWNSNTLATSCKELTHWKRPWYWEGLGAGGEGDARGWDGWMASPTQSAWVWVNSRSLWWTGRPGVLRFMGLQRVGYHWVTELNYPRSTLCFDWSHYFR